MGCDIHDYCEVKTENGWEMLRGVFNNYYVPGKDEKTDHPYDMRNYALFGMLAGVRSDIIPPISPPRGIPDDASEDYRIVLEDWRYDGHSFSYHTLDQLLKYPLYDDYVERSGCVSELEYVNFKEKGKPEGWSQGVGGTLCIHISNEEMDEYISNKEEFVSKNCRKFLLTQRDSIYKYGGQRFPIHDAIDEAINNYEKKGILPGFYFFTWVKWSEKVRDCIGIHWFNSLEKMKSLAPDGDFTKIRMVFFFDN